nr:hypothetical protein [Clostridioides difficile]
MCIRDRYGVNCLNVDTMGFELATKYNASYIQVDSVVGLSLIHI